MNLRIVSIFILLLTLFSGLASAATLEVGPGQKYLTIQSTVDAANTGDVVSVNDGVYSENVIVKNGGISIIGQNSWDDGKSGNYWNDHKTGDGYIISGAPKGFEDFAAVALFTAAAALIRKGKQKA